MASEEAIRNYKMPEARVGPAIWYHSPDSEKMPAIITNVSHRSVYISIFAPDNKGLLVKDGVRHVSDPQLENMPEHKSGCWDYTDDQYRLKAVEASVAALETSGAELLKALGQE